MAKRDKTMDAVEQRVVAFSEQLGRVVGTVQARAEGLLDRDVLRKQIAGVRDSAAELLQHLAAAGKPSTRKPAATGRSGGVVDAPGKKHRKPMPRDARAIAEKAKAAAAKTGKSMVKTSRLRGRG